MTLKKNEILFKFLILGKEIGTESERNIQECLCKSALLISKEAFRTRENLIIERTVMASVTEYIFIYIFEAVTADPAICI